MSAQKFDNGASFGTVRAILNGNADVINANAAAIVQQTGRVDANAANIKKLTSRVSVLANSGVANAGYRWETLSVQPGKDYIINELFPNFEGGQGKSAVAGLYIEVTADSKEEDAAYIHLSVPSSGCRSLTIVVQPSDVNRLAFDFMGAGRILSPDNQLAIGTVSYKNSVTFKNFVAQYKAATGIDLVTYDKDRDYLPFMYRMDCVFMGKDGGDTIVSVALTPMLTFVPSNSNMEP